MAIFTNQATLTYTGGSSTSNIAYGEVLEVLSADKTAVGGTYTPSGTVTYVVTVRNIGTGELTGLTVTDDLGGYPFGTGTLYPLTYVPGSVLYFQNGVLQAAPAVTAGPPLVLSGITVPAGGDTLLVYQARVSDFASPAADGTVVNTATVSGGGLTNPVTATETVTAASGANLSVTKTISPAQVADGDRVIYTLVIRNTGNTPVAATDNAVITDTFDPILSDLTVTLNGAPLAAGTGYTYNAATGAFATVPGQITVPAATVTQDPVTGAYSLTPGTATVTITGTI